MMNYNIYPEEIKGIIPSSNQDIIPSTWFDPTKLGLPKSIKEIFKLSKYFYTVDHVISAAVYKLAEYPITDIIYDTEIPALKELYEEILEERLEIKRLLVEIGLNYNLYGNVFISIIPPFVRKFIGKNSKKEYEPKIIKGEPNWVVRDKKLYFKENGAEEEVTIKDELVKSTDYSVIIWDPMNVEIEYNEFSGKSDYYYVIRKNALSKFNNKPEYLMQSNRAFLDAWLENKTKIKFNRQQLIVIQRPSPIITETRGWGLPLVVAALPIAFQKLLLRKVQQSIFKDRMLPYRFVAPPTELLTENSPLATNLKRWREEVEKALQMWRINPNYFGIFPVPIMAGSITGEGKNYTTFQEINMLDTETTVAMQVPQEFLVGGLQWSGSSVSLRMLENHFLNYRRSLDSFFAKLVQIISTTYGVEPISIRLKDFKMADDQTVKQMLANLYQLDLISAQTLLEAFEIDYEREKAKREVELEDKIEFSTKQAIAQAQAQAEAEKQLQMQNMEFNVVPENQPLGPNANLLGRVQLTGGDLNPVEPPQSFAQPQQPLPEKLPPRRENSPM